MRRLVTLATFCLVVAPATAQTSPVQQLLAKVPSLLGGGATPPRLTLPATPDVPGLTRPADRTVTGDPATFDLGGFRLGMSEEAVIANARTRGLKEAGATRYVNFESQVRSLINIRGGAGGSETGKGALGEITLKDDAGGSYVLKLLVWPDGSHLSEIVYLAPQGTPAAEWRQTLVAKWGQPTTTKPGGDLDARWGSGWDHVTAGAQLGPRGGTVSITSPDGTRQKPAKLVEQAADAFFAARAKHPAL